MGSRARLSRALPDSGHHNTVGRWTEISDVWSLA